VARSIRLPVIFLLVAVSRAAFAFDTSYWVWQRSEPLTAGEIKVLEDQGVREVYWQVGELVNSGNSWNWKTRFRFPAAIPPIHFIPVVRLVSKEASPFNERSLESLRSNLVTVGDLTGELQLDYDAPDRLLQDYSRALKRIHESARSLSITALPHWSRANLWTGLEGCADSLFPMFYDFDPEPKLVNDSPKPLIDSETMSRMLNEWSHSPLPWHAGLPAFARVTIYDKTGKSRGQIRNWIWDEITFNAKLKPATGSSRSTSVLIAESPFRLSNVLMESGDRVVVRLSDPVLLSQASLNAQKAGAKGRVFFRLPDSSAASGCSLSQLGRLDAKPHLVVKVSASGTGLMLENSGSGDLTPIFDPASPGEGYRLEIANDGLPFREAEGGDFHRLGVRSPGGARLTVPFTREIGFGFSDLRAGQSLQTGLIQLAPGDSFGQTRYRIQPLQPEWKPIELN
jgi:hypothetical protein